MSLTIIISNTESIEARARRAVRDELRHSALPGIPAYDRALRPSTCAECGAPIWQNINQNPYYCPTCKAIEDERKESLAHAIADRLI